ncbi:hypothetical protein DPMN_000471 [Dreissena polymorpha]|uniref:Uncharacterized protein n=1 Tax=Dreissena polymorpha TaxID=45954 RepID=A0A9D4MJ23_DREPO|nr:hypothetical protein DPMN_000471 [Dreissena polymorpha]
MLLSRQLLFQGNVTIDTVTVTRVFTLETVTLTSGKPSTQLLFQWGNPRDSNCSSGVYLETVTVPRKCNY